MATLYIVGTPIGNLEDITLRALRVLKEVDVILCEDTRVTLKLLSRYEIVGKQLATYNEQDSGMTTEKIVGWLEEGKDVALVSDAGTPGISDPGTMLVQKVREYFKQVQPQVGKEVEPVKIESVPGPSALTAALSIAGVPIHDFVFLGFLPHKKGRETLFKEIAESERTMIFYESPHRILKALKSLQKFLGSTSKRGLEVEPKKITVCRELTKIYEQIIPGTAEELLKYFETNPDKVRGEFVVIVS
ncbi:MAG: 16S rRNA (cytidine(1402)-2'-O)-methyltransferase [Candidatus Taylorbacteria bacterium]|nr:16S rRNA (cytidine(1402)-2'-O)-methyltransferase [Candidatus Taylorbacteria bacterium]